MKSLIDYIRENRVDVHKTSIFESESESETFTLSFSELENYKEIIEQVNNLASENGIEVESTEKSLTIKLTTELAKNSKDKIDPILDVLQHYAETIRKDSKNASSESYAQLTKKFADTVKSIESFIEEANIEEPEENEETKDEKEEE